MSEEQPQIQPLFTLQEIDSRHDPEGRLQIPSYWLFLVCLRSRKGAELKLIQT